MTVASVRELVDAELEGRVRQYDWVKTISQTTTVGVWYDIAGASGNPRAKQWFDATPLTAQQIRQSTDGGIFHGANVETDGFQKYLRSIRAFVPAAGAHLPMTLTFMDYLLYYPTIEDGTTDPQVMDNTNTLPRSVTGEGVQMMAVTISSRTGGQTFSVNYTNSDGVAGRVTPNVTQNASTAPGTITTAAAGANSGGNPFIPLQGADRGVRSVESVTMNGTDTGFFALVLVKPLATMSLRGNDAPYEKDMLLFANEVPRIEDDAFISLIGLTRGSFLGVSIRGNARFIWN